MKILILVFLTLAALAAAGCHDHKNPDNGKVVAAAVPPECGEQCKLVLPHEAEIPQPAVKELVCEKGYQIVSVNTFRQKTIYSYYDNKTGEVITGSKYADIMYYNNAPQPWKLCVPESLIPTWENK